MVWKCHDDLTGQVIEGRTHSLDVCIDGDPLCHYDVAAANPDDLLVMLGLTLAQRSPAPAPNEPAAPDPAPTPEPDPAPSPPQVNGAVLPPDPEQAAEPAREPEPVLASLPAVAPRPVVAPEHELVELLGQGEQPNNGAARLRAEEMLLDSDEAWTPKRVAEETGLTLSEAREVLAKVRRETRKR